ncbi:hypothetical protein ACEPPN_006354 [Leptodophora sp. 'Broadleaf-Isolate-01']
MESVKTQEVTREQRLCQELKRLCQQPSNLDEATGLKGVISDQAIDEISSCLNDIEHFDASARPRTYAILYMMGRQDLMPVFVAFGLYDRSIPYLDRRALPPALRKDAEASQQFLDLQAHVISPAYQMESGDTCRHFNLTSGDLFYKPCGKLGKGGEATVHKVRSIATGKYYARRRIRRRQDNEKDRQIQKDFENEVGILKNLDHTHLVKIVSSYTDPEFVAMLMEPVASMSLKDYLLSRGTSAELFESEREQFRCYYGCLAHALSYLHESKVRHKDIKPSNILIGQKLEIYIADFGSATEFSDENSMTMGSARARTFRYQSPELFRGAKRGRSSDVWSLGVTFLEMTTILRGETLDSMLNFFQRNGTKEGHVHANIHTANKWTEHLRQNARFSRVDNAPMQWIKDMLCEKPSDRPQAPDLFQAIMHASDGAFCGKCCSSDDSTTSGASSDGELDDDATVKAVVLPMFENKHQAAPRQHSTSKSRKDSTSKIKKDPVKADQHPTKSALHQRVARSLYVKMPNLSSIRLPGAFWSSSTMDLPNVTKDGPEQNNRSKGPNAQITEYLIDSGIAMDVPVHEIPSPIIDGIIDDGHHDPYFFTMPGSFPDFEEEESLVEANPQPSIETAQSPNSVIVDCQITEDGKHGVHKDEEQGSEHPEEFTLPNQFADTPCFEEFLFNPGPRGFITRIAAPPGIHSKAFKELLFCPAPRVKRRKSDETLQVTMATIEQRMNSLLADSERHSDDSSRNFVSKRRRGQLKLDDILESDMKGDRDELRRMKQELDQIFASRSFTETHESIPDASYFQTEDINTQSRDAIPVTAHGSTEEFVRGTARAFQDGGLSDPMTLAEPPKEITKPVQRAPPSFTPLARPQNPLKSRLASLRRLPQPSVLTGSNLGTLNDQVPPLERPRAKLERASVYMKKVFDDAASSVATSVMSETTRNSFKMAGLFLPSQDRSCNYLGEHTKTGKASAVRFLLQAGCNPGRVNSPRRAPIFNAVRGASSRHTKCLRALIDHGVDVNVWSRRTGETPLLEAVDQDDWSGYVTVLYLLLAAGANPNAKDPSGDAPLLKLLGRGTQPLEEHRRAALALLLSPAYKTNVNVTPLGTQNKPIHLAIRRNDAWAVDMLLEKDASLIEAENSEGLTPLLLAATFWRSPEMTPEQHYILDHLLERKANVNITMLMNNRTPLHVAVSHGLVEAVEKLLAHGADTEIRTRNGMRATDLLRARRTQHACLRFDDCDRIHTLLRTRSKNS